MTWKISVTRTVKTVGVLTALSFILTALLSPQLVFPQTTNTGTNTTTLIDPIANCLAGPSSVTPVCIINMAQAGMKYYEDSIFKMESISGVTSVRLTFYDHVANDQLITTVTASPDSVANFWRYTLVVNDFGVGVYKIKTTAYIQNTEVDADYRIFEIVENLTPELEVELTYPVSGEYLSDTYVFSAQVNREADVYFYITNTSGVLIKQLTGTVTATDAGVYKAAFDTVDLPDGQYFVEAEAVTNTESKRSDKRDVFINNYENEPPTVSFITPLEGSYVVGKKLFEAKTSRQAESVNFRMFGIPFQAEEYDENHWSVRIDTTHYQNGRYDIVAQAAFSGEATAILSNILHIYVNNPPVAEPSAAETTAISTTTTTTTEALPAKEDIIETENEEQSSGSTTALAVDETARTSSTAVKSKEPEVVPTSSTVTAPLPTETELTEDCRELGISDAVLCERYVSDPRPSRWCNLSEYKDEYVCQQYREQLAMQKHLEQQVEKVSALPQVCQDHQVTDQEKCTRLIAWLALPEQCRQQKISDPDKCEFFLRQQYLDPLCRAQGFIDEASCDTYLASQHFEQYRCAAGVNCQELVEEHHAAKLAAYETDKATVKEALKRQQNQVITVPGELTAVVDDVREIVQNLPFKAKVGEKIRVLAAEGAIEVSPKDFKPVLPGAIVHDADGDGLPDEMEERLGIDPFNVDTDGDSYYDGEEIQNGYDPLKPLVKLNRQLAPVEVALAGGAILEQPLVSGTVSDDVAVMTVTEREILGSTSVQGPNVTLSGQGQPFEVHTLYIYSDLPLVITVQADSEGRWEYILKDSLVDGEHQVFVTINDDTGRIVKKSNGFTFFVQEAQAITADEYITSTLPEDSAQLEKYYIYGAVGMVLLALVILIFLYREVKKKSVEAT